MKKTVSRLLALALTAALVLTGCSSCGGASEGESGSTGSSAEAAEGEITDLYIPRLLTRELETFNIRYGQRQEDSENLTDLIDGLLEADPGKVRLSQELQRNGAAKMAAKPGPSNCARA